MSNTVTYSLAGGADAARFNINAATGAVSFKVAPSYAAPDDAGADHAYDLVVRASDGVAAHDALRTVRITVADPAAQPIVGAPTPVASVSLVSTNAAGAQGDAFSGVLGSSDAVLSADGTKVAFVSWSDNLVSGDTNGVSDVFVKTLSTGAVVRVSTDSSGAQVTSFPQSPVFSPDGARVLYTSYGAVFSGSFQGDVALKDLGAGALTLVSSDASAVLGVPGAGSGSFSADGARVIFSAGSNSVGNGAQSLVPGDTNLAGDIYIKTLATGTVIRVSNSAAGEIGDGPSLTPVLSPDGTRAAFATDATNLFPGDSNGHRDIVIKDLATGAVTQVSVNADGLGGNGDSNAPVFSPDGSKVAFASAASNLVAGDTNGALDVFVKDLVTGAVTRVSTGNAGEQGNGDSYKPIFSADGTRLLFTSLASNFSGRDGNGASDVFVKDLATGGLTLVSVDAAGASTNGASLGDALSADGKRVLFESGASNLAAGDVNGVSDVFLATLAASAANTPPAIGGTVANQADAAGVAIRPFSAVTITDPDAAQTETVTVTLSAAQGSFAGAGFTGSGASFTGAFASAAAAQSALRAATFTPAAGQSSTTGFTLTVNDGQAGAIDANTSVVATGPRTMPTTTLISSNAAGVEGDRDSIGDGGSPPPSFTADGGSVLFYSAATNFTAINEGSISNAFVKTLATGAIRLVDVTAAGVAANATVTEGAISANGARVVFDTTATNLDPRGVDGRDHLYVKDLTTNALTLIAPGDYAIFNAQTQALEPTPTIRQFTRPAISADGRYVAVVGSVGANVEGFVFDTLTHTAADLTGPTIQVASGGFSQQAAPTLVFSTNANLTASASGSTNKIYAYSASTSTFTLVSTNAAGVSLATSSYNPSVSADGARVAFEAPDTNSASDINTDHVYVKSLTGALTPVDTTLGGVRGDGFAGTPSISSDGTAVSFLSSATNLDPRATDGSLHVYIKNLATGAITLADVSSGGALSNGYTALAAISPDGTAVAYVSQATNLVANDTNNAFDVFLTQLGAAPVAANTPPTISGAVANQADAAGVVIAPFSTVTVTDPDAGQSETVTVTLSAAANGTLSGGGFVLTAPGVYSVTAPAGGAGASAATAQAALRAAVFTPTAGQSATTTLTVTVNDGQASAVSPGTSVVATYTAPTNTPPSISGAVANQADAAGVAISPFAAVTVTDPDAGQTETVTVGFTAANGAFSGAGFTGSGGSYTGTFASAAAAQAALRAATFTPTAGQSATTAFALTVNDGQATASDTTTSVVATYTPPATGGGGGTAPVVPPSVQYGLLTQFQNLERALAGGADALNPSTPVYAAFQAEKAVAAQLDAGQTTLAQAEAALQQLVDGTTAVAVASYGFFTGFTPTAAGLNYLVHSTANATDLNDAYYARFTTENRYINFAVNLATGPGAGAGGFQATYGSLSLADATAKAYAAVFGATADAAKVSALLNTLVPDGLGGQETRAQYFAQYGGDGPNGQGTKAAMIGFLLSNAVHDGSGVYGAATEHYLAALAHGAAPAFGSELALTYGPPVTLVGATPTPDATVTG